MKITKKFFYLGLTSFFYLTSASTASAQSVDLAEAHRKFDAGHYTQAQTLFETAGNNGNADAQLFLGNFHYYGMGDKVDKTKAAYWYGLAGENGFVSAMLLLGVMLENGDGIDRSYEMARHWYDKAAKVGNAQGQTLLTKLDAKILHEQGNTKADGFYDTVVQSSQKMTFESAQKLYKDCDYAGAFKALTAVGHDGDGRAYNTLGDMRRLGQHVEKSPYIALGYYLKGVTAKDPLAQLSAGLMFEQGLGTSQSYVKAAKYYQLAVEGDNNRARAYLGQLYETGNGVKKNIRSARLLYGVAARSGDSYATEQLARLDAASAPKASPSQTVHVTNTKVKPVPTINLGKPYSPKTMTDRVKNLSNLADSRITQDFKSGKYAEVRKNISYFAEHGMVRYQLITGKTYFQEKNYTEAMRWYKRAAAAKNIGTAFVYIPEAQYLVGAMYQLGYGVPEDENLAAGWFALAADRTLPEKKAAFELGLMYELGKHIPQDDDKAISYYTKAGKEDGDALFRIGFLYEKNISKNFINKRFALEYYEKSAATGNPLGQLALGNVYSEGKLTNQSYAKAVEWFEKSAAQDNPDAQHNLAMLYVNGQGVMQSGEKAVALLKKAAWQDYVFSQYALGVFYSQGKGVEKSEIMAHFWFKKAAKLGDKPAQKILKSVGETW